MRWIHRHRLASFLESSHWVMWLASALLALAMTPLLRRIDAATQWSVLDFGLEGARALLSVLAGSLLSMLVFLLSGLLIAVQLASSQLTPRVVSVAIMRRGPVKYTVALVVFTFLLSVGVMGRTEGSALQLSTIDLPARQPAQRWNVPVRRGFRAQGPASGFRRGGRGG